MRPLLLLHTILWLCVLGGAFCWGGSVEQAGKSGVNAAELLRQLDGEDLAYEIGVLWFDKVAVGRLTFSEVQENGTFRAELEAHTIGVAAWLTRDRVQRYVSVMELSPDGVLRSRVHESHIRKGKDDKQKERFKRYTWDYENQLLKYERSRDGKLYKGEEFPFDAQLPPSDILTALFNFRLGAFGPLRSGSRYVIPAFTRKGPSEIIVETLSAEEQAKISFFPAGGLLCKVTLDPEIFDTRGGKVYAWLDEKGRPGRGIVENIIGLGSIRGRLQ